MLFRKLWLGEREEKLLPYVFLYQWLHAYVVSTSNWITMSNDLIYFIWSIIPCFWFTLFFTDAYVLQLKFKAPGGVSPLNTFQIHLSGTVILLTLGIIGLKAAV